MKKIPRVYCASIATETNTFSPLKTDLKNFKETFYAEPNEHPKTPTLCSAVFPLLRNKKNKGEVKLIEGTATWAEPGGLINSQTWNYLKNKILSEIKKSKNLDIVILGLHGAMISHNCIDCEGDLIKNIRNILGAKVIIGVTFDPHSHLSKKCLDNSDIITVFKEFPHTDFVDTARNCINLSLKTFHKIINPKISSFDVKMMTILPTSKEPMKSFVDKLRRLEKNKVAVSLSVIHGFMAGDSPDIGAKIITITDDNKTKGDELSSQLGLELFSYRNKLAFKTLSANKSIEQAAKLSKRNKKPILVADIWDNPGGGVAGDSTILIKKVMAMKLKKVAVGSIWDPKAVSLCHEAGENSFINIKFGSNVSSYAGKPINKKVFIKKNVKNAFQKFGSSFVPMGDSSSISFDDIEVILNTNRCQAFSTDLFTTMGINISDKKIIIIKSTNHFYESFYKHVSQIIYASVNGIYPNNIKKNNYLKLKRSIWPIVINPHKKIIKN